MRQCWCDGVYVVCVNIKMNDVWMHMHQHLSHMIFIWNIDSVLIRPFSSIQFWSKEIVLLSNKLKKKIGGILLIFWSHENKSNVQNTNCQLHTNYQVNVLISENLFVKQTQSFHSNKIPNSTRVYFLNFNFNQKSPARDSFVSEIKVKTTVQQPNEKTRKKFVVESRALKKKFYFSAIHF